MKTTKAVILAAGEGRRMLPLTYARPKVLLPVANKPILEHLLVELREAGIREMVFVVGYQSERLRGYFGDGARWGVSIEYRDQKGEIGTAAALKAVVGLVDGWFLMVNGDVIVYRRDIEHLMKQTSNAMTVIERADTSGFGVVEVNEGRVIRIYEKASNAPSHLVNAGLYLFSPDIFGAVERTGKSSRGEYEITDSLQILIDSDVPVSYHIIDHWLEMSYPWDLLAANERILAMLSECRLGEIEANVVTHGVISVGKGSRIRSGSYIIGPVVIGENCEIGPNCYIRPSTAIGDSCHIGAATEVKNSIIMRGTKIPHLSYVGDSIIGEGCNLGAGTKIANLRLDKKEISVAGIKTKRRKLGAIIGDGVETGINASINVGTFIGNNSFIGPGVLAHGIIPPGSKILPVTR
ncbi:MAG: NTP transferase domain-containing protein [Chloroflexi bacterium]|nr:NTP transferase domain-containing protein [Chloroflexota bacterium]